MAIGPANLPPLLPLSGVSDSGKSMDRDARERARGGRGFVSPDGDAVEEEPAGVEEEERQPEHFIDEAA